MNRDECHFEVSHDNMKFKLEVLIALEMQLTCEEIINCDSLE